MQNSKFLLWTNANPRSFWVLPCRTAKTRSSSLPLFFCRRSAGAVAPGPGGGVAGSPGRAALPPGEEEGEAPGDEDEEPGGGGGGGETTTDGDGRAADTEDEIRRQARRIRREMERERRQKVSDAAHARSARRIVWRCVKGSTGEPSGIGTQGGTCTVHRGTHPSGVCFTVHECDASTVKQPNQLLRTQIYLNTLWDNQMHV